MCVTARIPILTWPIHKMQSSMCDSCTHLAKDCSFGKKNGTRQRLSLWRDSYAHWNGNIECISVLDNYLLLFFFSFSVDGISFVSLSIAINSMGAVYLHWNGFGRNCTQQRANVSLSTLKWSTWPMTKKSLDMNTTTANGMNITNAQTHIQCSKFLATTNQNSIKARAICYQLQAERINFAISMWFWCERAYHWLTFVSANGQSIWFDVWWNTSRSDWKLPPITGWKKVRHFNFHILGAAFSLSALYTLHAVFLCEWM